MIKISKVNFGSGESRHGTYACDYIMVNVIDDDEEERELYAETEIAYFDDDGYVLDGHDEWEAFPGLCEEIVEQAAKIGIKREPIIAALKKAGVPTDASEI